MAHEINKLQLQILEALHIKTKNLEFIKLTLKIATMFWNVFSPILKYSIFLDNILYLLIVFCFEFVQSRWHLSFIQFCIYVLL